MPPVGYANLQKTFRDASLGYFLYRENYNLKSCSKHLSQHVSHNIDPNEV